MSLFEFISGMIGVLLALAIAQQLVSIGRLAQYRDQVKAYWPHTLWNVSIFLVVFLHWWSLWDFRDLAWNSAMFFYSLMGPLLLFFSVTLLSPDLRPGDGHIDLKAHYQKVRILFLLVFLAALGFLSFDGPLFGSEPMFNILRATQLFLISCIVVALLSERSALQFVTSLLIVLTLVFGTAVRFLPGTILN